MRLISLLCFKFIPLKYMKLQTAVVTAKIALESDTSQNVCDVFINNKTLEIERNTYIKDIYFHCVVEMLG